MAIRLCSPRVLRAFLAKESPPALVRRLGDDPVGQSTDLNAKMTKQGWTGILVPKANGGLGLGMLDAAVLLTELGRFLAPCPFLSSAVLATSPAIVRRLGLAETLLASPTRVWRGSSDGRVARGERSTRPRPAPHCALDAPAIDFASPDRSSSFSMRMLPTFTSSQREPPRGSAPRASASSPSRATPSASPSHHLRASTRPVACSRSSSMTSSSSGTKG